jgi:hypothetical protein
MAVQVAISVSVPMVSLDAQGNSHAIMVTAEPGRAAGELKITFQPADLATVQGDGGAVYLTGADLIQAQQVLQAAAALAG